MEELMYVNTALPTHLSSPPGVQNKASASVAPETSDDMTRHVSCIAFSMEDTSVTD